MFAAGVAVLAAGAGAGAEPESVVELLGTD